MRTWQQIHAESHLARVRRARAIDRILAATYPDAHCALDYRSPLQLLVATILSAQCTDVRVNLVTPALFARYRDAAAYAAADRSELESIIRSTGFFRAKADHIIGVGEALVDRFYGTVPHTLAELVTLPGVGRKTANVVLGNAFGIPGLTIDTHFGRLARRLGWSAEDDPVKVERDVADLFEPKDWTMLSHRIIWHGRAICTSRSPRCAICPVADLCPSRRVIVAASTTQKSAQKTTRRPAPKSTRKSAKTSVQAAASIAARARAHASARTA